MVMGQNSAVQKRCRGRPQIRPDEETLHLLVEAATAEFQANVLEPFYKLDSARNDRGGFGLGLSIVQDIVQAHSGTLTLANAVPHGLIVEIGLPPVEPIVATSREETRSPRPVNV